MEVTHILTSSWLEVIHFFSCIYVAVLRDSQKYGTKCSLHWSSNLSDMFVTVLTMDSLQCFSLSITRRSERSPSLSSVLLDYHTTTQIPHILLNTWDTTCTLPIPASNSTSLHTRARQVGASSSFRPVSRRKKQPPHKQGRPPRPWSGKSYHTW